MVSICFFRVRFWAIVPANVLGLRFGFIIDTLLPLGNVLFTKGFRLSRHDLPHKVHTVGNDHPQLRHIVQERISERLKAWDI